MEDVPLELADVPHKMPYEYTFLGIYCIWCGPQVRHKDWEDIVTIFIIMDLFYGLSLQGERVIFYVKFLCVIDILAW